MHTFETFLVEEEDGRVGVRGRVTLTIASFPGRVEIVDSTIDGRPTGDASSLRDHVDAATFERFEQEAIEAEAHGRAMAQRG